jgi:hypothetical protein
MTQHITKIISIDDMLPAVAQVGRGLPGICWKERIIKAHRSADAAAVHTFFSPIASIYKYK